MLGLVILGVPWLILFAMLVVVRARWPAIAWGGIGIMLVAGVAWPAGVYLASDQPTGPPHEDAWPPWAVATLAAWAGLFLADVLGFAALGMLLGSQPGYERPDG